MRNATTALLRHPEVAGAAGPRRMSGHDAAAVRAVTLRGSLCSHLRVTALALASLAAMSSPAKAQSDYPNRTITLVVPLPPGGTTRVIVRFG